MALSGKMVRLLLTLTTTFRSLLKLSSKRIHGAFQCRGNLVVLVHSKVAKVKPKMVMEPKVFFHRINYSQILMKPLGLLRQRASMLSRLRLAQATVRISSAVSLTVMFLQ